MIRLSVIIVNYNVEYFLEQCLYSVFKALQGIESEVFVVDNSSVDGSVQMVKEKFPEAILIANKDNTGFSKANNQAIRLSNGKYVLLLNPDTLVEEDTFSKVLNFMDANPQAGGLGVKMIDGKGKFLPESKRGLPTPSVAFYKIFGLSTLFPKSKRFAKYHLGYLPDDEINEVEILSGAFMLMRKEALDKVGLLDEEFFMYGEDIDLSYRLILGGYKNYFFPETRIIHYKGESTKKSSINYVFVFYKAMVIFARKHFSAKNAELFSVFINAAIYLRAGIAIINRFIKKAMLPLIDALVIIMGLFFLKDLYEKFTEINLTENLVYLGFIIYTVLWQFSVFISGGYDKPINLFKIYRGIFIGTIGILILYALIPESFRFSRALILLGAIVAALSYTFIRTFLHFSGAEKYRIGSQLNKKFAVIGSAEEVERVSHLISQTDINISNITPVFYDQNEDNATGPGISRLREIIEVYQINEVIFCAKDIASQSIIELMSGIDSKRIDFKIAPPESLYIIGSNSINKSGELFILDLNSVTKQENERKKRILDIIISLCLLISSPVTVWFVKHRSGFIKNIFAVLFAKKTWVGFSKTGSKHLSLPKLKPGVISPIDIHQNLKNSTETARKLDIIYARDYSVWNDLQLIRRSFNKLGRQK